MDIKEIAKQISKDGGRLYLVGGAVRDSFMKIIPKDYDYCITGLNKDTFLKKFPNAKPRGKAFEVYEIDNTEFAFARKERKVSEGHKGFEIYTTKEISIEEDLKRRDITINSIAVDVLTEIVIDPFNGCKDIEKKIIRATSNAFLEDPLRTYRVARFASQLDFNIEPETIKLMSKTKNDLANLSLERVVIELEKALSSKRPSSFFKSLKLANCLNVHFKEIYDLIGKTQPEKYHPEGDSFNHTMQVIDRIAKVTNKDYIVFAGLVHDIGKGITPENELPHHIGHDKNGRMIVENLSKRLNLSNKYQRAGITGATEHMKAGLYDNMRTSTKVDFLVRNYKTTLGLDGLEILANADRKISDKKVIFADIGKKMMKEVNAKNMDKNIPYKELIEKLRKARIEYLREIYKKI